MFIDGLKISTWTEQIYMFRYIEAEGYGPNLVKLD